MYNIPAFCSICFNNKEELKNLNNKDCLETQILSKLNFCNFETDWLLSEFPIYICRKCNHILDLACDFKTMCLKSNKILRGYMQQLKNTESAENIRNEIYTMFNNVEPLQKNDPGPSNSQSIDKELKIKAEEDILFRLQKQKDNTDKLVVQVDNISFCDIKNEFSDLGPQPVENLINSATFNFDMKQSSHQCTLCQKTFSRESVLTRHMLIHTGQKPHCCSICNKSFTHKFNLKQHLLIHSGHKNHHCSVCDKGFIKKSDLDRHMLTHFGERIHHCSLCSKSFVRKENLNQHILTHSGQKPHHCTQCTKSFLRKSDLNRHTLLCINKRN